jgi:hypothetical protein
MNNRYAKVGDSAVIKVGPRPRWVRDDGNPVSDDVLAAWGWFPIIDSDPKYDQQSEKASRAPFSEWVVGADHVETTWVIEPLTKADLAQRGEETIQRIQDKAEQLLKSGVLHNGKRWSVDLRAVINTTGATASIGAGRGNPKGRDTIPARDISRTKHHLTQSEYLDLGEARRDYYTEVQERADDLVDAVLNGTFTESMLNEGWPE